MGWHGRPAVGCSSQSEEGEAEEGKRVLAKVFSCAVVGLDGVLVDVEVDVGKGLPATVVVGSLMQGLLHRGRLPLLTT
jgi:hypothetical protein